MKSVIRNVLKVAFCCLLAVVACIGFFDAKSKTNAVLTIAEQTVEDVSDEQVNPTPDENGLLNLEKWEDYALSDFDETSEDVTGVGFVKGAENININGKTLSAKFYYTINDAAGLATFAKGVNSGSYTGTTVNIVLTADIDLSGKIWTPIGVSSSYYFQGTFFGNGHIISGITIDSSISVSYKALFGYSKGTISDLIVNSAYGTSYDIVAGGSPKLYGCTGSYVGALKNPAHGVTEFYYELVTNIEGDNGEQTVSYGTITSKTSLTLADVVSNYKNRNLTVYSLEVREYSYILSTFYKIAVYGETDDNKITPMEKLIINPDSQATNTWRKYFYAQEKQVANITASYAHQSYIKIVLNIGKKYVKQNIKYYVLDEEKIINECTAIGSGNNAVFSNTLNNIKNNIYSGPQFKSDWITLYALKTDYFTTNPVTLQDGLIDITAVDKIEKYDDGATYYKLDSDITFTNQSNNIYGLVGASGIVGKNNYKYSNISGAGTASITFDVGTSMSIYIYNIHKFTVNYGTVEYNNSVDYFNNPTSSSTATAYNITNVVKGGDTSDKIILDDNSYAKNNPQMLEVYFSLPSQTTYCGKINTDVGMTNIKISSLSNGATINAIWCVKAIKYDIDDQTNGTVLYRVYQPFTGQGQWVNRNVQMVQGNKIISLYYTEQLYIYDFSPDRSNDDVACSYLLTLKGENDAENKITTTRDFRYEALSNGTEYVTAKESLNINVAGSTDTKFYGAVQIKALYVDGDKGTKYVIEKSDKKINVYLEIYQDNALINYNDILSGSAFIKNLNYNAYDPTTQTYTNIDLTRLNSTSSTTISKILLNNAQGMGNNGRLNTIYWTQNVPAGADFKYNISCNILGTEGNQIIFQTQYGENYYKQFQFYIAQIENIDEIVTIQLYFTSANNLYHFNFADSDNADNLFSNNEVSVNGSYFTKDNPIVCTAEQTYTIDCSYLNLASFDIYAISENYETSADKELQKFYIYKGSQIVTDSLYSSLIEFSIDTNGSKIIITPASKYYIPRGIYIDVTLSEIQYELQLEVTNGKISNVSDENLITKNEKSENTFVASFKFSYLDTIKSTSSGDVVGFNVYKSQQTSSPYLTFNIEPINGNYVLNNNTFGIKTANGEDILNENLNYKVEYMERPYEVNVTSVAFYNGEYIDLVSNGLMPEIGNFKTDKGNVLAENCKKTSNYLIFSHFEIKNLNEDKWYKLALQNINTKDYVVYNFSIIISEAVNGGSDSTGTKNLTTAGPYSKDGLVIRAVYTPNNYNIIFKSDKTVDKVDGVEYGTSDNYTTVQKTLNVLSDQTLVGVLSIDGGNENTILNATGYKITGFKGQNGTSYDTNSKVSDAIKSFAGSVENNVFEFVVQYTGLAVKFNFINSNSNELLASLDGIYGQSVDFTSKLQEINEAQRLNGYVVAFVEYANKKQAYTADESFVFDESEFNSQNFFEQGDVFVCEIKIELAHKYVLVDFDDTYLTGVASTNVEYNTNNYLNVPVPTRFGFSFAYWKAISNGKEFYIYLNGTNIDKNSSTIVNTLDASLTFYAYWRLENTLTSQETKITKEYSSNYLVFDVASFVNANGLTANFDILFGKDQITFNTLNTDRFNVILSETAYTITTNFKYVTDSCFVKVVCEYEFVDQSGPASKDYCIGGYDYLTYSGTTEIEITPKALSIAEITKVYDGTNSVNQNVEGIFNDDKALYLLTATYASINQGSNIEIEYVIDSSVSEQLKASYTLPDKNSGTITPLNINVTIKDGAKTVYKHLNKDSGVVIANILLNKAGTSDTSGNNFILSAGVSSDAVDAWNILKESTIVKFDVVTNKGETGTYYTTPGEKTILISNLKINDELDVNGNYNINLVGRFNIEDLGLNQKGFMFSAVKEDTQEILEPVVSGEFFDNYYENNVRTVIVDNCFADTLQLFNITFSGVGEYCIKEVIVKDTNGNTISNANFTFNSDSSYVITISVDNHSWYDIKIIFTNKTEIILDYVLAQGELINGQNSQTLNVSLGQDINFGNLQRDGFVFVGWTSELNDETTLLTATKWLQRVGKVVLHALWKYEPQTTVSGDDIVKTYDGQTMLIEPNYNKINTYLTYQVNWLYSSNQNSWSPATSGEEALQIRNVAQSGFYAFTLNVSADVQYLDNAGIEQITTITYLQADNAVLYQLFNAQINKKDLNLIRDINKVFDSGTDLTYALSNEDLNLDEVASGDVLANETIYLKYANTNVGASIIQITHNSSVLYNYNIFANGTITKRHLALNIGTQSVPYADDFACVQVKSVVDSDFNGLTYIPSYVSSNSLVLSNLSIQNAYFSFKTLYVSTLSTKSAVGTYDGEQLQAVVKIVDLANNNIDISNFAFTINGTLTITKKILADKDVTINSSKTYNGQTQTITSQDITIAVDNIIFDGGEITFQLFDTDNSIFGGAENVGKYTVRVVISSLNYEDYTKVVTFEIKELYVKIQQIGTFEKRYDALTDARLLVDTDYSIMSYTDINGNNVEITDQSLIKQQIELNFMFNFLDKNVANNIEIALSKVNQEYKNIVLLTTKDFTGNITKEKLVINIGNISRVYVTDGFYVLANQIALYYEDKATLLTQESLVSGRLKLNKLLSVSASAYNIADESIFTLADFVYDELTIGSGDKIDKNYEIVGFEGTIKVVTATVSVQIVKDASYSGEDVAYIYSGKNVSLNYTVTITTNDEDIQLDQNSLNLGEILSVSATAVSIGNYLATATLIDTTNYTFENNKLSFNIIKKDVNVTINCEKVYDKEVLNVLLSDDRVLISGVNDGHKFVSNACVTTKNSLVGEYYVADMYAVKQSNIIIIDQDNSDVTSNYNITLEGTLKIVTAQASPTENQNTYVYNGKEQTLEIYLVLNSGDTTSVVYDKTVQTGEHIKLFKFQEDGSLTTEENGQTFKYAGKYRAQIYSPNFDYLQVDIEILPKEISVKNLTGYNADKQYDGTNKIGGTIVSDDIVKITQGDVVSDDGDYIQIVGTYSSIFGDGLTISFVIEKVSGKDVEITNNIFNSYKLSNDAIYGNITKRKVVFQYVGIDTMYYLSSAISLGVNNFKVVDLGSESFALSESFSGSCEFGTIINAGTYNLSEISVATVNFDNLSVTSDLNYYSITFANTFVLNKARVVVQSVTNLTYTYNAKGHIANVIAIIDGGCGAIAEDNNNKILKAQYAPSGKINKTNECIDVGTYDIYPEVSSAFEQNYEYVGNEIIDQKLVINARKFTIKVEKSIYFAKLTGLSCFEYEISNADVIALSDDEGLVAGHTLSGVARTLFASVGNYSYDDGNVFVELAIVASGEDVLKNYSITYDIKLNITDDLSADEFYIKANDLIYNGNNQASLAIFAGVSSVESDIIVITNAQYYSDKSLTKQTTSLINAGTYYAKVEYTINGLQAQSYPYIIDIVVRQKEITSYKLLDTETEFNGNKTYDGTAINYLSLVDICEADKANVEALVATYYDKYGNVSQNAGTDVKNVVITLKLASGYDYLANNYILYSLEGVIAKREVVITLKNDVVTDYVYCNEHKVELLLSDFVLRDCSFADGESLTQLELSQILNGVGTYKLPEFAVEKSAKIEGNSTETTDNYIITFDQDINFVVTALTVSANYVAQQLTYTSFDQAGSVKDSFVYNFILADCATVSFEELQAEIIQNTGVKFNNNLELINAGTYSVSVNAISDNFVISYIGANTITVAKANISINFTDTEISYTQYLLDGGYILPFSKISGIGEDVYSNDSDFFGAFKFLIKVDPIIANVTYTYSNDADTTQIRAEYQDNGNYEITSIVGSLMLADKGVEFFCEKLVYTGLDLFDSLDVKCFNLGVQITDIEITRQEIINAGTYTLVIEVNDVIYHNVEIEVEKYQIRIDELSLALEKQYDGNNIVYNTQNSNILKTFTNDGVIVMATYASATIANKEQKITYIIVDPNYDADISGSFDKTQNYILPEQANGKILPREVTFTYANDETVYYTAIEQEISANKFEKSNVVAGDEFGGVISFAGALINCGTYNIAEIVENYKFAKTFSVAPASLDCYNITFVGTFTIEKAVVKVLSVDKNEFLYDAKPHAVMLSASIVDSKGAIATGKESSILTAKYMDSNGNLLGSVVNAGAYEIVVVVADDNYEFDGSSFANNLVVSKRVYSIDVVEQFAYDAEYALDGYFAYTLTNANTNEVDTTTHKLQGEVRTQGYSKNTYSNQEGAQFVAYVYDLSIAGVAVYENGQMLSGSLALNNYDIRINISLTFGDTYKDGEIIVSAEKEYEYNATNQIADIRVEIKTGDGTGAYTSKFITIANTDEFIGIYAQKSTGQNKLTEVKNQGKYFAYICTNANSEGEKKYRFVTIIVNPKQITSYTYNASAFVGDKTYDGLDTLTVTSNDVFEADRDVVVLTAHYSSANVGARLLGIFASGNDNGNYVIVNLNSGSILARKITIGLSDAISYVYAGASNKTITADKFALVDGSLAQGQTLAGQIDLQVCDVKQYSLSDLLGIYVADGQERVDDANYEITIEAMVSVTKRAVNLSWNNAKLTYMAKDLKLDFVNLLTCTGNEQFIDEIKQVAVANFDHIFNIYNNLVIQSQIVNAGTYALQINEQVECNFTFNIEEGKNELVVEKNSATINFVSTQMDYTTYKANDGFIPTQENVTGLFEQDKQYVGEIKFVVVATLIIGEKYVYSAEEDAKLICVHSSNLIKNYNFAIVGDLTLFANDINLTVVNPTYEGNTVDLFDKVKVYYEGNILAISKLIPDQTITFVNTNYYVLAQLDESVKVKTLVQVQPKEITNVTYDKNKQYDGTNAVLNVISSDIVSGDNVSISGTYGGQKRGIFAINFKLTGDDANNYKLNLAGASGEITPKEVQVVIDETITFVYLATEQYSYTFAGTLALVGTDSLKSGTNTLKFNVANTPKNIDIADITQSLFVILNKNQEDVTDCYKFSFVGRLSINARKFDVVLTANENLIYNTLQKEVNLEVIDRNVLTSEEKSAIKNSIVITYTNLSGESSTVAPTNASTYTARAVYTGTNYQLESEAVITFTIIPFTLQITEQNAPYFEVNEDDIATATLSYAYSVQVKTDTFVNAVVSFEKADDGEEIGYHNIAYVSCDNPNINVICESGALENKLYITASKTKTLVVTLLSYKNGDFARTYGCENIGLFNLIDFNYTAKVGAKTLTANEINVIQLLGTITFASGDAKQNEYGVESFDLSSAYVKIEVETELKLTINKRQINLTLADGENYNKVFDGTNTFTKQYTLSAVENSDTFVLALPQVTLSYEDENVGQNKTINILVDNNYQVNLIGNSAIVGNIDALDVNVELSGTFTYGELVANDNVVDLTPFVNITSAQGENLNSLLAYLTAKITTTAENLSTSGHLKASLSAYSVEYVSSNFNLLSKQEQIVVEKKDIVLALVANEQIKPIGKVQDTTTDIALQSGEVLTLMGVLNGDNVTIASAKYASALPASVIEIVVTLNESADNANYNLQATYGTILPKTITILFNYTGTNSPTADQIVSGIAGAEYNFYEVITSVPTASHSDGGYSFKGWSKVDGSSETIDFSKPLNEIFDFNAQQVNVYAIWEVNQFTVTFNRYLYDFSTSAYEQDATYTTKTVNIDYGQQLDLATYTENVDHYTYLGYQVVPSNQIIKETRILVLKNIQLVLLYDLNKHTITFTSSVAFANRDESVFTYSNNFTTASITGYYGQTLGSLSENIVNLLTLQKVGYNFTGFTSGTQHKTTADLASMTIAQNESYTAEFEAISYTLTLSANGGNYNLTSEQTALGWEYADAEHTKVQIEVVYDQAFPELVSASKNAYNFAGYNKDGKLFSVPQTYTFAQDIELVAVYSDVDFALTVVASNATSVVVKAYENGQYLSTLKATINGDEYTFNVYTSLKVEISVIAKDGYTANGFKHGSSATAENLYIINSFTQNERVEAVVNANDISVKISVNGANLGYVKYGSLETSASSEYITFNVKTGQTFIFDAIASEGFKVDNITVVSNKQTIQLADSVLSDRVQYTVSGFVCDFEISISFVAKQVEIAFNLQNITLNYNDINYTSSFVAKVYVGTQLNFTFSINKGYLLQSVNFVPTGSLNNGLLEQESIEDGIYAYSFKNFTSNGTITIALEKEKYQLEVIFAEYDEQLQQIVLLEPQNVTLLVNGQEKAFGTFEFEFGDSVNLNATFALGFKLYGWKGYVANEFIEITNLLFGDGVKFDIDQNITICLISQRQAYNITYVASVGGYVTDTSQVKMQSFTEKVYFGRTPLGATAICKDYTTFEGWYNGETLATTDLQLLPTGITQDTTFVAQFKGEEIILKVVVKTNTKRDELLITESTKNSIFNFESVFDVTLGLDANGNQTVTATVSGLYVNDALQFTINLPEWFVLKTASGANISTGTITLGSLYPTEVSGSTLIQVCTVNLSVKTFKVTLKTNIVGTVSAIRVYDNNTLLSAKVLQEENNLAEFVVEYGGKVQLAFEFASGYMLQQATYQYDSIGTSNMSKFVFEAQLATMQNIYADTVVTLEFAVSKFRVLFDFNFADDTFADTNTYVYYTNYGDTTFTDENGNAVTLPQSIVSPESLISNKYMFMGWNNSKSGEGKYNYLFDENGEIYQIKNGQIVYGFEYDLNSYSKNGAIEVVLYGYWNYSKFRVDVEFAPYNITFTNSKTDLFNNNSGMYPVYSDTVPRECSYVVFAVGSNVDVIAPKFEGYKYYGWKIKDEDTEISKGTSSIIMPAKAITVVLYYTFEIKVEVEEPVTGANSATVNGGIRAEVVSGQAINLVATAGKGYKFVCWKKDGVIDDTLGSVATVYSDVSCTYTAVFESKGAVVVIENNDFATLSANETNLILGQMLVITLESILEGYNLENITINNIANQFTLSSDGTYYYHLITIDDVENGTIVIRPVTMAKTVSVLFSVKDEQAGVITINNANVTNQTLTYNYNMEIGVKVEDKARYYISKVLVNGQEISLDNLYSFVIVINTDNHFDLSLSQNTVEFVFEKLYWINSPVEFIGEGTSDNPYLIQNAEQLAYMASEINSGRFNQTPHKYYKLANNIDLSEKFWIPIGTSEHPFDGTFILNEHQITGVYLNPDETYEVLAWENKLYGVFGYITENAELIYKISKLAMILLISISALVVVGVAVVLIIVITNKRKKIKKLSKEISKQTMEEKPIIKHKIEKQTVKQDVSNQMLSQDELKQLEKMIDEDAPTLTLDNVKNATKKKIDANSALKPKKQSSKLENNQKTSTKSQSNKATGKKQKSNKN